MSDTADADNRSLAKTEYSDGRSSSLSDQAVVASGVGLALLDTRGVYQDLNEIWAHLLGLSSEALMGKRHFDEVPLFLMPSELSEVFQGQDLGDNFCEFYDQDQDKRQLRWSVALTKHDPELCIVSLREVEAPDDMTADLIRQGDRLKLALEGADYGLWDWNVTTGHVYFSRQYMEMLGYGQYDLPHVYDTWKFFCDPEDVIEHDQAVEDYLNAEGTYLEDEFQMRCKDGRKIWILSRGKIASFSPDGSPLRIVGTHQDITLRKAYEQALVEAKEDAEKASRAKSDFLALVSHEVRTPLNAVTSILKLLADEPEHSERDRLSGIALSSCDQLLAVLSDVLDVSKMEAGRFDLHLKGTSLKTLLDGIAETQGQVAKSKGLVFTTEWSGPSAPNFKMDPVRVAQILNNFLSNAIKFTEAGSISLRTEVGPTQDGTSLIRFIVEDQGPGLTAREVESLFQPFRQLENARNRKEEGIGLGLSICKKLAELMDGRVWCDSTKGVGSVFGFEVRLAVSDAQERDDQNALDALPAQDRSAVRLLAAEDNPINRLMLEKFLVGRLGYSLTLVENGLQALKAIEEEDFGLVLMDIHMPEMNGLVAVEALRAAGHEKSQIPVIALTADATDQHVSEYKDSGFDDCVSKPIDWDELDATIFRILERDPGLSTSR